MLTEQCVFSLRRALCMFSFILFFYYSVPGMNDKGFFFLSFFAKRGSRIINDNATYFLNFFLKVKKLNNLAAVTVDI